MHSFAHITRKNTKKESSLKNEYSQEQVRWQHVKKEFLFFYVSCRNRSFSQAAKKHYLSQAAISQQISKLEEEVGVRLFDREVIPPLN